MPEDIVVIGAGGFGRETLDVIEAINADAGAPRWNVIGVVDDAPSSTDVDRLRARGYRSLGTISENLERIAECGYVIAIGSPSARSRVAQTLSHARAAAALIHPRATVGSEVTLGEGVVICAGSQISTNVRFGDHVHVNPGATVGHDTVLCDFVSVNPGAIVSGSVDVQPRALVGAGAIVLQGLRVGEGATVGAAACAIRDVEDASTVVGVPARVLVDHRRKRIDS